MIRLPRWYKWQAVVIGEVAGVVAPLAFVRFRKEESAAAWVDEMNAKARMTGCHFAYGLVTDRDPSRRPRVVCRHPICGDDCPACGP